MSDTKKLTAQERKLLKRAEKRRQYRLTDIYIDQNKASWCTDGFTLLIDRNGRNLGEHENPDEYPFESLADLYATAAKQKPVFTCTLSALRVALQGLEPFWRHFKADAPAVNLFAPEAKALAIEYRRGSTVIASLGFADDDVWTNRYGVTVKAQKAYGVNFQGHLLLEVLDFLNAHPGEKDLLTIRAVDANHLHAFEVAGSVRSAALMPFFPGR